MLLLLRSLLRSLLRRRRSEGASLFNPDYLFNLYFLFNSYLIPYLTHFVDDIKSDEP